MKNLIVILAIMFFPLLLLSQIGGEGYTFNLSGSDSEICLDATVSAGPFKFSKEIGCVSYQKLTGNKWRQMIDIGNLDFFIRYRQSKGTWGIKATWKGHELSGWRINIYQDGSMREKDDFVVALSKRISEYGL